MSYSDLLFFRKNFSHKLVESFELGFELSKSSVREVWCDGRAVDRLFSTGTFHQGFLIGHVILKHEVTPLQGPAVVVDVQALFCL